ncbi:MAG: redoxin domain-containing protein [Dysgonamonadaceae bacterium]|jgi:hypothetical protein|nr:redoxin domain-containing protein [Dysgonamonadaceae bacterium]
MMVIKKMYLISLFMPVFMLAKANTAVRIELPHFADKQYVFYLMHGDRQDTVQSGYLDKEGKTFLALPEMYRDFIGMSKFMIVGEGGLEIILNREPEFTVSCTEAMPNMSNIHYVGSAENNFLFEQYGKQIKIIERTLAVEEILQLYSSREEPLFRPLQTEFDRLHKQYAKLQDETAQSRFYAARIREMGDFLQGLGSRTNLTEEEIQHEQRDFVLSKIDFQQLYNSGLWNDVLGRWIGIETGLGDSILLADTRNMLARCKDQELHREFINKLIILYNKYGKENLLSQLGVDDLLAPGHYAPKLRLENAYITPVQSLVIFYESGCNSCENELVQLRANYRILHEQGLRVISISADRDEGTYRKNADLFTWTDKYCDYKGFSGENFINYQAVGTPIIFVINKEGIITGRYARLAEYLQNFSE